MTASQTPDPGDIPVAPKGIRQRDFTEGWRASEARHGDVWLALERATALVELYGNAIVEISAALPNTNRVRLIIAGLDTEGERPCR